MSPAPSNGAPPDDLAREIERLMHAWPAEPKRAGDDSPIPPYRPSGPTDRASLGLTESASAPRPSPSRSTKAARPSPRSSKQTRLRIPILAVPTEQVGAWLRTVAAVGLGTAVAYWPYARPCSGLLLAYLGTVAAVLVTGGWASVYAWRARSATAHILALMVVFWGIVLSAEQILPRIGYAGYSAAWVCGG